MVYIYVTYEDTKDVIQVGKTNQTLQQLRSGYNFSYNSNLITRGCRIPNNKITAAVNYLSGKFRSYKKTSGFYYKKYYHNIVGEIINVCSKINRRPTPLELYKSRDMMDWEPVAYLKQPVVVHRKNLFVNNNQFRFNLF